MDVFLAIVAGLLVVLGVVGSVLPVLPGPPLSFIGLFVFHYSVYANYSSTLLIICGIFAVGITILDYFIPAWGTKKFGGSKQGRNGAMVGVFAGLFFFPPIGIILGPFVGAFIGELIHDNSDYNKASKSAIGSLIGFLLGTGLKLIYGLIIIYLYIKELIF
jgi:uncharacterized protein YqgC (DUF456 family)